MKKLDRNEMASIAGGGSCSATCQDGSQVNCNGEECEAEDGVGCFTAAGGIVCAVK